MHGVEEAISWLNFRIPRNFGPPQLHVSGGFDFVNSSSGFFILFFCFAFQKNLSFFSSCRKINFSLQPFSITLPLIYYSVRTECYIRQKLTLHISQNDFIPKKTIQINIQIRLHKVSLVKSRPFGAWLPEKLIINY